jgi:hypothetical protein
MNGQPAFMLMTTPSLFTLDVDICIFIRIVGHGLYHFSEGDPLGPTITRCTMALLREELQTYTRVCETLLSAVLEPELTEEERDLIMYYANELLQKFGHRRNG